MKDFGFLEMFHCFLEPFVSDIFTPWYALIEGSLGSTFADNLSVVMSFILALKTGYKFACLVYICGYALSELIGDGQYEGDNCLMVSGGNLKEAESYAFSGPRLIEKPILFCLLNGSGNVLHG
jgi:hypothetical protein